MKFENKQEHRRDSSLRLSRLLLAVAPMAMLLLACYGSALFGGRQFGYRDAGYYYYPLYQKVQQEWAAGRWPLWEIEENAGMPLMGNPTAAVLYPGKLIYACFPYAWGARLYTVAHGVLAFVAMGILMRSLRASATASVLAALAYAFAAPVLFQTSNVIYLVGAAWLPLGFHAADRWIRLGRRWGLVELAVVLAMLLLGGDAESAYLLGLASGGYAGLVAWFQARGASDEDERQSRSAWRSGLPWALGIAAGIWFVATVALGIWLPGLRPPGLPDQPNLLPWMAAMPTVFAAIWGVVGSGFLWYWRGRGWRSGLGVAWSGLALSALLAAALTAAQLLPVLEFTRQTQRAGAESAEAHNVYSFSLEPFRLVEMVWPNVFGVSFGEASQWASAVPVPGTRPLIWAPSLYGGGLILLLALSAFALRRAAPSRVWLSAIAVVSLAGSLGQYTSPIWATRAAIAAVNSTALDGLSRSLGPLDPAGTPALRNDGYLRDGDGGVYWAMTVVLPGFRQFRFPSKLFAFTVLAIAALAGLGWDDLSTRRRRRSAIFLASALALSLAILAGAFRERQAILDAFRSADLDTLFGPFDSSKGFAAIVRALAQGSVVFTLGLAAVGLVKSRPGLASALVIIVTTADLALANARYVITVPQAAFDAPSEVLDIIKASERNDPSPGPFRVHRIPVWTPLGWRAIRSADRETEFTEWEIDTLQPKFGINQGVEFTDSRGVGELYEYSWFFRWFRLAIRDPKVARNLQIRPGQPIVYYPRRSFDLWNTRYFVVPMFHGGWNDEYRSYAAFVYGSEILEPPPQRFQGPDGAAEYKRWTGTHDYQVFRNRQEMPRAWVVHSARPVARVAGTTREDRWKTIREIAYCNDLWNDPRLSIHDPRTVAWLDRDDLRGLARYLPGRVPGAGEIVKATYPDPQHVELTATLDAPGIVVLADVYYPGWTLTIDGRPAPILKVNRLMRGAAVDAGTHTLVYTYRPLSFVVGVAISVAGLIMLAAAIAFCVVKRDDRLADLNVCRARW